MATQGRADPAQPDHAGFWANYFRHAVCKHTLDALDDFVCHRVIRWQMKLHRWRWKDVRRRLTGPGGRWRRPSADGIELFNLGSVPVSGISTGAVRSPAPGLAPTTPDGRYCGEPAAGRPYGTAGSASGLITRSNPGTAPGRLNQFVEDQSPVGDLGPRGEHEPSGMGVRPWASRPDLDHFDASAGQDRARRRAGLPGRSRYRNRKLVAQSPRSIRRVWICCVVHGPVRVS